MCQTSLSLGRISCDLSGIQEDGKPAKSFSKAISLSPLFKKVIEEDNLDDKNKFNTS